MVPKTQGQGDGPKRYLERNKKWKCGVEDEAGQHQKYEKTKQKNARP